MQTWRTSKINRDARRIGPYAVAARRDDSVCARRSCGKATSIGRGEGQRLRSALSERESSRLPGHLHSRAIASKLLSGCLALTRCGSYPWRLGLIPSRSSSRHFCVTRWRHTALRGFEGSPLRASSLSGGERFLRVSPLTKARHRATSSVLIPPIPVASTPLPDDPPFHAALPRFHFADCAQRFSVGISMRLPKFRHRARLALSSCRIRLSRRRDFFERRPLDNCHTVMQ